MPDNAAQQSDSAPESFEQYQSLKSAASASQSETEEKVAPASEPVEEKHETTPLTDEQKADRKRRNDERRERRWYEERGEMRAQMRQLQSELEDLRTKAAKPDSAPAAANEPDFENILNTHLQSGKYKTYEAALAAANKEYFDHRETALRQKFSAEQQATQTARTVEEHRKAYNTDAKAFAKAHEDYDDIYADVASALDSEDDRGRSTGNAVTRALLTSKQPASLIYHIGTHPELLEELADLLADDEEAAAVRVGEIRASLRRESPPAETTRTPTGKARAPRTLAGTSAATSRDERMRAAVDANDFTAFQAASRGKA